jgi:hypothetical protein
LDPRERLSNAQQAAAEGRHAEALRGYEWFHRNALRYRPSLYGVRLSFALWYWTELDKVYAEALRSLERIRKAKMAALSNGRGSHETFHDVASINQHLGKERDTHRLFAMLAARRPRMAAKCARLALPSIVKVRDFKLALRYMPDPEIRLARHAEMVNRELPKLPRWKRKTKTKAPIREAYIANYCDDAALLIKVLGGSGLRRRAALLRKSAVALIDFPSVRRLVAARLGQ